MAGSYTQNNSCGGSAGISQIHCGFCQQCRECAKLTLIHYQELSPPHRALLTRLRVSCSGMDIICHSAERICVRPQSLKPMSVQSTLVIATDCRRISMAVARHKKRHLRMGKIDSAVRDDPAPKQIRQYHPPRRARKQEGLPRGKAYGHRSWRGRQI
jgi:hypothetical protein